MNGVRNKIIKSGFSSVLQIIAATVCYVVIYAVVLLKLGKEQLGIWSVITSIPTVVSFLGSGVAGSLLRFIPAYIAEGKTVKAGQIFFNGFVFNIIVGAIVSILGFIFALPLLRLMFGIETVPPLYQELFTCAIVTFLVNFITSATLSVLDGLQEIVKKNKILIISSLVFCVIATVLISTFGLKGLLYAQLFQALLVCLLSLISVYRLQLFDLKKCRLQADVFRVFLIYGGKLQLISILNIFFEPITKFFLNRYFGLGTVGIYDLANRLVSQLRMLIVNAVQVIVPFVAKEINQKSAVENIYQKSFKGALLLSAILFGGLISAGFSVIYMFKNINVSDFQIMLVYLSIANIVNILSAPAYAIRLATGKVRSLVIAQVMSTLLNIFLFLLLGTNPTSILVLAPTGLAIVISSGFVIINYKRTLSRALAFTTSDISILFASLVFPVICIFVAICWFNIYLLLLLVFIQIGVVVWLALKNEYLGQLKRILLQKTSNG